MPCLLPKNVVLLSCTWILSILLLAGLWPHGVWAQDWETTAWTVTCDEDLRQTLPEEDCDPASVTGPAAFTRAQLETASEWLRGLGFSGPDVEQSSNTYVARISDQVNTDKDGNRSSIGVYNQYDQKLYLTSDYYFAIGSGETDEEAERDLARDMPRTATAVHELFHAVEHTYHQGDTYDSTERDWIWEGMADAVMLAWLRKQQPDIQMAGTVRTFDSPLHEPNDRSGMYDTHVFWRGLGKILGAKDDLEYLHDVLQQDLDSHLGLQGVDVGLREWDRRGLYYLYPEFIAQYTENEVYFEEVRPLRVTYDGEREETSTRVVRKVAANAYVLEVRVPEAELAGLTIEFEQDHDDLHLIVDGRRVDVPGLLSDYGEDQMRLRRDARDPAWNRERNVFQSTIAGQSEPYELWIRVANVAHDADESVQRTYTLNVTLEPLNPCEPEGMRAAMKADLPQAAMLASEDFEDADLLHPGAESALSISGIVSGGGNACSHHLSALDMTGAAITGRSDTDEIESTMRQRGEEIQESVKDMDIDRLQSLSEEELRNMSPEERRQLLSGVMEMAEETAGLMGTATEEEEEVVLNIYSPHLLTWQSGNLSPPRTTEHGGLAGWPANAAANLVVQLPGTTPRDLREGGTYDAVALAPEPESQEEQLDAVPTLLGFYTWWEGRFIGPYFEGTTHILTGSLSGTVTIEEKTGVSVKGTFELSGAGTLHLEEYVLTYDSAGQIDGDQSTSSEQPGPVRIRGRFSAPNHTEGLMRGIGYRSVVIE